VRSVISVRPRTTDRDWGGKQSQDSRISVSVWVLHTSFGSDATKWAMTLLPRMTQEELESGIATRVLKTNMAVIYIERGKKKGDWKRLHGEVTCSDHLGVTVAVLDTNGKKYAELLSWSDDVDNMLDVASHDLPTDWEKRKWTSDQTLTPDAPPPKVPRPRLSVPVELTASAVIEAGSSSEEPKSKKQKKHNEPAKPRVDKATLKQVCALLDIKVKGKWTVEDIKAAIIEAVKDA
jgi:hypothetical protein